MYYHKIVFKNTSVAIINNKANHVQWKPFETKWTGLVLNDFRVIRINILKLKERTVFGKSKSNFI